MSFTGQVKEELAGQINDARHCRLAELAAMISLCGKIHIDEKDRVSIKLQTENDVVARKYFTIIRKTFNINTDVTIRRSSRGTKSHTYVLNIHSDKEAREVLLATRLIRPGIPIWENDFIVSTVLVQQVCCKRAFLRGAFLSVGSVSDPQKAYHFEMACQDREKAQQLTLMMKAFDIEAKIVQRKKHFVVYLKEGTQIVDMLNIMGAHISLLEMENVRALKETRNTVNRRVNCETANINKTVSAAMKQVEDIEYIKIRGQYGTLADGLKAVAELRVAYPEASLVELGAMLTPPVGKSGVNHRLRKLGQLADELRKKVL